MEEMLCRVCLKTSSTMVPIFDEAEDDANQSDLSLLLEECGNLKVLKDDSFSTLLCEECMAELLTASRFREKCHKAKEAYIRIAEKSDNAASANIVGDSSGDEATDRIEEEPHNGADDASSTDDEDFLDSSDDFVEEENGGSLMEENTTSHTNSSLTYGCENGDARVGDIHEEQKEILTCPEPANAVDDFDVDDIIVYEAEDCDNDEDSNITIEEMLHDTDSSSLLSFPPETECDFVCDQCGAAFKKADNLLKHAQKQHAGSVKFICEMCQHCFTSAKNLSAHFKECRPKVQEPSQPKKTNPSTQTLHCCIHCGKRMASPFALEMHIRTHTNERPFQCNKPNCEKAFKTRASLQAHIRRHSGQKNFACNLCPRRFYDKNTLKDHLRWHRNDRPHVCTLCNKRFTRVFLLQVHMRIHKNDRPYKCDICSKTFVQNGDLICHRRLHAETRPYQCEVCKAGFIRQGHLKKHKATQHGAAPKKPEAISEIDEIFDLIMNQTDDKSVPIYDDQVDSLLVDGQALHPAVALINDVDLPLDFFLNDLDIQET